SQICLRSRGGSASAKASSAWAMAPANSNTNRLLIGFADARILGEVLGAFGLRDDAPALDPRHDIGCHGLNLGGLQEGAGRRRLIAEVVLGDTVASRVGVGRA